MIASQRPLIGVVGGANVDIGGVSDAPLSAKDSNPGRVSLSMGGVGRNIAHNLCLLGADVRLLTALGNDSWADHLTRHCAAVGLILLGEPRIPGERTGTYLYIADADGDMALAISDMGVLERLTPARAEECLTELNACELVALDANLRPDTITFLCERVKRPLMADPVSVTKAPRLKPVLGRLHTLKPNRQEAEVLSGVPIRSDDDLPRAAERLLNTGLKRVMISLGARGIYAADAHQALRIPACPAQTLSATGAGDAMMAALLMAEHLAWPLEKAARYAAAASALATETRETINPALSHQAAVERM